MITPDPKRACLSCRCPRLLTYRQADTYCSACGHLAARHVAPSVEEQLASIAEVEIPTIVEVEVELPSVVEAEIPTVAEVDAEVAIPAVAEAEMPTGADVEIPSIAEDPMPSITLDDDDLEEGWRAALPSGIFVAVAIAGSGMGLIIAGLAMRFQP